MLDGVARNPDKFDALAIGPVEAVEIFGGAVLAFEANRPFFGGGTSFGVAFEDEFNFGLFGGCLGDFQA